MLCLLLLFFSRECVFFFSKFFTLTLFDILVFFLRFFILLRFSNLDLNISRAILLFSCWLRLLWALAEIPVSICVRRTALSVVFTCWPPFPLALIVSTLHSSSRSSSLTGINIGSLNFFSSILYFILSQPGLYSKQTICIPSVQFTTPTCEGSITLTITTCNYYVLKRENLAFLLLYIKVEARENDEDNNYFFIHSYQ